MRLQDHFRRRPLLGALVFEGLFIPAALLLAIGLGVAPWAQLKLSAHALAAAGLATLPPLALLALLMRLRPRWLTRIERRVGALLEALFADAPPGSVAAVSLVAGFGEELLFRGVLQPGLEPALGPAAALLAAALLFGLAHYISPAYCLLVTAVGIYLGLLYRLSGNLLLPCLVHALYDWVAIRWSLYRGFGASSAER